MVLMINILIMEKYFVSQNKLLLLVLILPPPDIGPLDKTVLRCGKFNRFYYCGTSTPIISQNLLKLMPSDTSLVSISEFLRPLTGRSNPTS